MSRTKVPKMPKVEKGKFLYKGNRLGGSLHAVHGHTRPAIPSARFQDGDVFLWGRTSPPSLNVRINTSFKVYIFS